MSKRQSQLCSEHKFKREEGCGRCAAAALGDIIERGTKKHELIKPSTRPAYLCALGGKRCKNRFLHTCTRETSSHVWDHSKLFVYEGKPATIKLEPYGQSGEAVVELVEQAKARGLHVTISGNSPWFPGSTFLIEIRNQRGLDADKQARTQK